MTAYHRLHGLLPAVAVVAVLVGGCSTAPAALIATGPAPWPAQPKLTATHAATTTSSAAPVVISFVNVGEGAGIVIKDGSWAGLVDGGRAHCAGAVAAELASLGVTRLDAVLATHPDADHIGDLAALVKQFRPPVAYSDDVGTTKTYRGFMAALHAVHTRVVSVFRGHVLALGPLKARVLNPAHDGSDTNADSIVLLFDLDGHEVLLTGDDYGPSEDYVGSVVARGPPLYILKVAHHGSKYATSAAFLAQTRPRYAVISVGHNSYGHPAPATLARLRAAHATIYTTQTNGTISVTFLASGAVRWSFAGSSRPLAAGAAVSSATAAGAAADRHATRGAQSPLSATQRSVD